MVKQEGLGPRRVQPEPKGFLPDYPQIWEPGDGPVSIAKQLSTKEVSVEIP